MDEITLNGSVNAAKINGTISTSATISGNIPGAKGAKGDAGFSPIIQASKTGKETTITITDATGTKSVTLLDGLDGVKGDTGDAGFSPLVTTSKTGKVTTITITDALGEHTATINDGQDGQSSGDMQKSVYDANDNGIVDNAEKVNNHTVESDVPANAVFTDTIIQYSTMPTASADNLGNIIQYIGTTDSTYTNGYWYKCVFNDNVYSWLEISGGSGSVDIDNSTITENTSGEIQTVGVIDQNTSNADKIWTGTLAQYNNIQNKDSDTYYFITDDQNDNYRENVEVITSQDTSYTITNLTANKSYKLGELTTLTISACETFDEETVIYFNSGSVATVLSMPNDVVLIGDEIEADKSYIIAILNKIAVIKGYEVE